MSATRINELAILTGIRQRGITPSRMHHQGKKHKDDKETQRQTNKKENTKTKNKQTTKQARSIVR